MNGSFRYRSQKVKPILIKREAWIAGNCTIVAGVTIGRGTLIGANSVVVKDVLDNCLVADVPAKFIKKI